MIYNMRHINRNNTLPFLIVALSSTLFACSVAPQEPPISSAIDESIEKATHDIQASLKLLASTQNALASKALTPAQIAQANYTTSNVPAGMNAKLTLHWEGPIEPAVKTAASASGYDFRVDGKPSIPPVIVRLSADQKPIIQILEDIGLQAGASATVDIVTQGKVVYLHYGDKDAR
jgi:hypothetical protein